MASRTVGDLRRHSPPGIGSRDIAESKPFLTTKIVAVSAVSDSRGFFSAAPSIALPDKAPLAWRVVASVVRVRGTACSGGGGRFPIVQTATVRQSIAALGGSALIGVQSGVDWQDEAHRDG